MLNYILRGEQFEDAGGIFWTWKRILSGQLFDTEGIWLPTRLIVFQGVQFVVSVVMIFIFFTVTKWAADEAEEAQANLDPDLPDWVKRCARRFPTPFVIVHSQKSIAHPEFLSPLPFSKESFPRAKPSMRRSIRPPQSQPLSSLFCF